MYSRTQNENGTFNTRCLYCFLTVASAVESREDLMLLEAHHLCPERVLAELAQRVGECPGCDRSVPPPARLGAVHGRAVPHLQ